MLSFFSCISSKTSQIIPTNSEKDLNEDKLLDSKAFQDEEVPLPKEKAPHLISLLENLSETTLIELEEYLKERDIDEIFNYENSTHWGTALNYYLEKGDLERANILLDHGADPNFLNSQGNVPLVFFLNNLSSLTQKEKIIFSKLIRNRADLTRAFLEKKLLSFEIVDHILELSKKLNPALLLQLFKNSFHSFDTLSDVDGKGKTAFYKIVERLIQTKIRQEFLCYQMMLKELLKFSFEAVDEKEKNPVLLLLEYLTSCDESLEFYEDLVELIQLLLFRSKKNYGNLFLSRIQNEELSQFKKDTFNLFFNRALTLGMIRAQAF